MKSWVIRCALLLVLLGSYWLMYQHGRSVERANAGLASAQRDSGDRLAEVIGERGARQEEQRRAQAQEEARAHAQEERTIADAGAAGADAAGQRLRDEAGKLAATISCPARIPPLSPEARQPPAPPWCSPTCSHGLMNERESWRQRLTEPELPAASASASTKP